MGKFLESEKLNQIHFKVSLTAISEAAQQDGVYRGKPRPFCLPVEYAIENLYPGIRKSVTDFFSSLNIKWHDGQNRNPSNHLCDSQVCCVNFLAPFAEKPDALRTLFSPFFPNIYEMLPVEDGNFVSFEWIGAENYLGERSRGKEQRTRGANFTSADAIILFERLDHLRQAVLIEWKYTESYGGNFIRFSKSGTDRLQIYQHLFDANECPIEKISLPMLDSLFYEPFYQLMRQQFLAHEMEKAHELGCDIVSYMHMAPELNLDFKTITSPALKELGSSATSVWKTLVKDKTRFSSISTDALFCNFLVDLHPEMKPWAGYIKERYGGITQTI